MTIYNEIEIERQKALSNIPEDFEDKNSLNDYIAYVIAYLGRASDKVRRNEKEDLDQREMLIKAAGLLVTAIEKKT